MSQFVNQYKVDRNGRIGQGGIENFAAKMVLPEYSGSTLLKILGTQAIFDSPIIQILDFRKTKIVKFENTAMYGLTNLEELYLPETIQTIELNAISGAYHLRKLHIPKYLKSMTGYALNQAGITNYTVDPTNKWFCTDGRNLYSKNKTVLIAAGRDVKTDKEISWINSVRTIGECAFTNNPSSSGVVCFTTFTAPSSVDNLETYTFHATFSAEYIDLSQTKIKVIPKSCFEVCMAKTVKFPNTLQNISSMCCGMVFAPDWLVLPASLTTIEDDAFKLNGMNPKTGQPDPNYGIKNISIKGCKNFANNNIFTDITWGSNDGWRRRNSLIIYAKECYIENGKPAKFGHAPVRIIPTKPTVKDKRFQIIHPLILI